MHLHVQQTLKRDWGHITISEMVSIDISKETRVTFHSSNQNAYLLSPMYAGQSEAMHSVPRHDKQRKWARKVRAPEGQYFCMPRYQWFFSMRSLTKKPDKSGMCCGHLPMCSQHSATQWKGSAGMGRHFLWLCATFLKSLKKWRTRDICCQDFVAGPWIRLGYECAFPLDHCALP